MDRDISELSRAVDRVEWRLEALDRWRDGVEKRMNVVQGQLEQLDRAAEIARAVAKKEATRITRARSSRYTRGELTLGSVVAASAVGGLILQLVGHAG